MAEVQGPKSGVKVAARFIGLARRGFRPALVALVEWAGELKTARFSVIAEWL